MMDTPTKTQISTPLPKFEDSPVFNYINNLSPIKPVKSVHITQTFNPVSFASLPSVFTSPHVRGHKESRFLKRHNRNSPDPNGEGNKVSETGDVNHSSPLCNDAAELSEDLDPRASAGEASFEMLNEPSTFLTEPPPDSKYDCGSQSSDLATCVVETYYVSESVSTSLSVVPLVKQASKKDLPAADVASEVQQEFKCPIEQKEETMECDWENLISDAAGLLIFSSPNGSEAFNGIIQKSLEPGVRTSRVSQFPQSSTNELPSQGTFDSDDQDEEPLLQPRDTVEQKEVNDAQGNFDNTCIDNCITSNSTVTADSELASNLYRGMRRRCLDFETQGAKAKGSDSDCNSSEDKQLVPLKPSNSSSHRILPGIGLHLNALAITSSDNKSIKHKVMSSGRQKLTVPGSSNSMVPVVEDKQALHESFDLHSTKEEIDPDESGAQLTEGDCEASLCIINEEFNQNSPKKKRRKSEAGEAEACKRCNCKKSKCLKLYCECFAAGVYCIEPCSCQDCYNKPIHEDTVLATRKQIESRNPLAFAPKVIRSSDSIPEGDDFSKTPASARHKRGCNCKKSNCLKKYCECFQGGVGCSIGCRCEGCKNAFGQKDGPVAVETEEQEEEAEPCKAEKALQQTEIQNIEEQNPGLAVPATPIQSGRPLVQLPFSSKSKLSQPLLAVGSSSGLHSQAYGKPDILQSQTKVETHLHNAEENDLPEMLQGSSPSTGMKTSSPNSKRISPPNVKSGMIPGRRGGRKLILQSIPSFPSLTPQH